MSNQRDDDDDKAALAKDDLDNKDTEQLLADGEMVGTWSDEDEDDDDTLLAGDESVGPWSEDDLEFGLKADSDTEVEVEAEESADVKGDEDIDQLSDMPDPRARR